MKIVSWNVNGIRAAVKKDFINEVIGSEADIYCVQETKAQDDQVIEATSELENFTVSVNSAIKKGYSGVATFTKTPVLTKLKGIGEDQHDLEGRVLITDHGHFNLVNVYVPNSGSGLKRLDYRSEWDRDFAKFLGNLRESKPVIVTGDFNVAHQAIDLARPKSNYNKTSGYTQVEIDGISNLLSVGFVDAYRMLYPEKVEYTFWSVRFGARAKNIGWRLDYFLVDERLKENISNCQIHTEIMGSDHCPLSLEINL